MANIELTEATAAILLEKHAHGDNEVSRRLRRIAADRLGVSLLDEHRRAKYRISLAFSD